MGMSHAEAGRLGGLTHAGKGGSKVLRAKANARLIAKLTKVIRQGRRSKHITSQAQRLVNQMKKSALKRAGLPTGASRGVTASLRRAQAGNKALARLNSIGGIR
jgi:hypothetical protein